MHRSEAIRVGGQGSRLMRMAFCYSLVDCFMRVQNLTKRAAEL